MTCLPSCSRLQQIPIAESQVGLQVAQTDDVVVRVGDLSLVGATLAKQIHSLVEKWARDRETQSAQEVALHSCRAELNLLRDQNNQLSLRHQHLLSDFAKFEALKKENFESRWLEFIGPPALFSTHFFMFLARKCGDSKR